MDDFKSLKVDAPKYDGKSDFTMWQSTIKDVLIQQSLDDALEEEKPEGMKDSTWKLIQKKAGSTIRLALAPEVRYSVLKEDTPKAIWDKLASIYASKSMTNRLMQKVDLYSLKMDEGGNLHDHISTFNQRVCQLANIDNPIKDEEQAVLLLSSLPTSYKHFKMTLLNGRTSITLEDVLSALRDNERMTREADGSQIGEKAYVVESTDRGRSLTVNRGGPQGRSKSRPRNRDSSNVECYYCGERGHYQSSCPSFRSDLKSLKLMKAKSDGEGSSNFIEDGDVLMASAETESDSVKNKSEWVIDSAASMHICNDRALFDKICSDGDFGYINVGNSEKMKVQGVGTVHLKLHNGAVKKALNVGFVPDATKNIISLGVLTSRGYSFVGRGQNCKIIKGKCLVCQGKRNEKNLYCLQGEAVQMKKTRDKSEKTKKMVTFSDYVEVREFVSREDLLGNRPKSPNY